MPVKGSTEDFRKQNSHTIFMPHLAYIDPDEEIISVISRLRKTSDTEMFFVVPKRALFVRSLVNLRLLEREAKKLGKRLCLVTPDEEGRSLAQKAGIESRVSLEGIPGVNQSSKPSLPARIPQTQVEQPPSSGQSEISPASATRPHSESIGSESFFAADGPGAGVDPRVSQEGPASLSRPIAPPNFSDPTVRTDPLTSRSVPVRDRTPKRLTALNSVANVPPVPSQGVSLAESPLSLRSDVSQRPVGVNRAPESSLLPRSTSDAASRVSVAFPMQQAAPLSKISPQPSSESFPISSGFAMSQQTSSSSVQSALSRFYRKNMPDQSAAGRIPSIKTSPERHSDPHTFRWILLGGMAISLLAVLCVALIVFVPRADVTVVTKELSTSLDVEISARADQEKVDVSGKTIPLRVVEAEKDIVKSFPSTGQSSVSDRRARGMITVSNAFGSSPQSLVATTRFESLDGKIFRLAKGVTVPGAREVDGKTVPGTIDAEVIADASGKEYNIDPTTFTIPGLKGSPKYEKISASSPRAFSGGGDGGGAIASVSADDVARAKDAAIKALPESLRNELEKDLQPGEKLLDDAILSETLSSDAFPSVGAVASSFDFRMHVSARALVFSESDVRIVAAALLGGGAKPEDIHVEYTVPHPDFTAKAVGIKARVSFEKGQSIDVERIKRGILGKSVSDVQSVLADYPNIQKIEVVFWPEFMTSRIPSRTSQVSVHAETTTGGM